MPGVLLAQTPQLHIGAGVATIQPGQQTKITVALPSPKTTAVNINFSTTGGALSPTLCSISPSVGFCAVDFVHGASSPAGTFTITASATGYASNSVQVTVATPSTTGMGSNNPNNCPTNTVSYTDASGKTSCLPDGVRNYKLLTPLPSMGGNFDGQNFDATKSNSFSTYLNLMIRLIIGICAVLAMLMIVVGGIEYMTTELVSHKDEGKKRILGAIGGLILALGSYVVLNTINPDLLITDPQIKDAVLVTIGMDSDGGVVPTASNFPTGVPAGAAATPSRCPEGIKSVSTAGGNFTVCGRIAQKLTDMIAAAKAQGVNLGGWGWRTRARQMQLRAQHCNGDLYSTPPSQCKPPTAFPGTSMHETGLAVDFTCNGSTRGIPDKNSPCFIWLDKNAETYGFINLPSEAWHWSTSGR